MSNYSKTTDFEAKDSLPTGDSGKIIRGAEFETEFDAISTAIATKADTAGPTFTGTLTFETISDGTIGVTAFVDEDNMASDSATLVPTQQSVKAYVDSQVTAQDLDFQADSGGALSIDLDSEALTLTGGTGIDTSGALNEVTFAIDSTVATLTGTQTLTNKTLTTPTISGNLTTDGTIDGRDVAADGTKLDGIESGATADQTAAEIRTLVDSATDSNVFTDADHTKLDGIEASATADQTDAEIRAAVEAATDSNVFTDADHTKLDGIEASADVTDTANVTAAGALMDSEVTNLAQVKAFDSADYATAAQGTTADSALQNVVEDTTPQLGGDLASNGNDILFADSDKAIFGAGSDLQLYHDGGTSFIDDVGTGNLHIRTDGASIKLRTSANADMIVAENGGAAKLYHAGSQKLATLSTGIDVTGTVTADGLNLGDNEFFLAGASGDLKIGHDGTDNLIRSQGPSLYIDANNHIFRGYSPYTEHMRIDSGGTLLMGRTTAPPTAGAKIAIGSTGDTAVQITKDGVIAGRVMAVTTGLAFGVDGVDGTTERMRIDSDGNVGIGTDSPAAPLEVAGSINSALFNLTGAGTNFELRATSGSGAVANTSLYRLALDYLNGSFTNGFIDFYRGSAGNDGYLAFGSSGTEAMRIDSSGNVGIGTSSPSAKLGINAAAPDFTLLQSDAVKYRMGVSNITNGGVTGSASGDYFARTAGGKMLFSTNDGVTAHAVIDSSGNLLVGKTADNLTDAGQVFTTAGSSFTRSGGAACQFNRNTSDGEVVRISKDGTTVGSIGTNSGIPYFLRTSGGIAIGNTALLSADSSGAINDAASDLGGASNRWKDLYLSGNINLSASSQINSSTAFYLDSDIIHFRRNNESESARIDSSGNLLVGTTTSPSGSGCLSVSDRVTVGSQSVFNGFGAEDVSGFFYSGGSSGGYVAINSDSANACLYLSLTSSATTSALINFSDTGTAVGTITTNGTTTSYNTSSDQRLKDNIVDAPSASDDIDAIQVRSFDWKADGSHQKYGMVAQELNTVAPEAVTTPEDPEEMMGVDYSKLVPMMLKEIQSLRARVAQLEGEN